MLELCPMTLKEANAYVEQHHRHHKPVTGHKFSIGCTDGKRIVGVAIVGRPVSRHLDDGWTLEVNRLCTDDELEELFRRLGFEIDESEDGKYFDGEAFLERMKKTDRYFAMKNDIEIPRRRRYTVVVTRNRRTDNGAKMDGNDGG